MVKPICQIVLALLFVVALFLCIKSDIEGEPGKPAKGFRGVVQTIITVGAMFALLYGAGGMSEIIR